MRIGIDIGGVCSIHGEQYESEDKKVEVLNMPGCIEALQELKKQGHYLVIVSFCGKKRAEMCRQDGVLAHFHEGYFVKDRKYKNDICRALGLDILIDDRAGILETIQGTMTMLFGTDGKRGFKPTYQAKDWPDVLRIIPKIRPLNLVPTNKDISSLLN